MNVYQLANDFKRRRLQLESEAASGLIDAYGAAWQRLRVLLDRVTHDIEIYEKAGGAPNMAWLGKQERYQTLMAQMEHEIRQFAHHASVTVKQQQAAAITAAGGDAHQLILAGLGPHVPPQVTAQVHFNRVPVEATSNLVGALEKGPLKQLLDKLPAQAGEEVARALKIGMITGSGPRKIAQDVKRALGGNLVRALRISRTEVMRAYRLASLQTYRENSDVVEGWIWMATLSKRTCAACLAMSGTWHPLEEEFGSHVNCRCAPVPATKPLSEIVGDESIKSPGVNIPDGVAWFDQQAPDVQMHILGPAKFAAYQVGAITLDDLVGYKDSKKWGPERFEAGLKSALTNAAADRQGPP